MRISRKGEEKRSLKGAPPTPQNNAMTRKKRHKSGVITATERTDDFPRTFSGEGGRKLLKEGQICHLKKKGEGEKDRLS